MNLFKEKLDLKMPVERLSSPLFDRTSSFRSDDHSIRRPSRCSERLSVLSLQSTDSEKTTKTTTRNNDREIWK